MVDGVSIHDSIPLLRKWCHPVFKRSVLTSTDLISQWGVPLDGPHPNTCDAVSAINDIRTVMFPPRSDIGIPRSSHFRLLMNP